MRYRIELSAPAERALRRVSSAADRRRLTERIATLADDPRPHGCKKLAGGLGYRVRQGDWRIGSRIEEDRLVVAVVRIADRRDVYR